MYRIQIIGCLVVSFLLAGGAVRAAEMLPPIKGIEGIQPERNVFDAASRNNPLVIRSADAAAKHFSRKDLERLTEQVDFDKQFVLVFAWRGSGQDKLTYDVAESFPEQIMFSYKPGRTRDLRSHVYIFALRSNVKWRGPGDRRGQPEPVEAEYIRVEAKGKLNSQVVAIGGETTGFVITARGIAWELEFGDKADLRRKAKALHGEVVVVSGQLNVKQGVEIRERSIVTVDSLKAVED